MSVKTRSIAASKRFLVGPQIDFMGPGRALLAMDLPVGFGDRIDPEQTVVAALGGELRRAAQEALACDAAVDDDMRDMKSPRGPNSRAML